jgi:hypothetical protein
MSQEKIRHVLDFPKPDISKQLRRFLGLVNYFHDFIKMLQVYYNRYTSCLQIIINLKK